MNIVNNISVDVWMLTLLLSLDGADELFSTLLLLLRIRFISHSLVLYLQFNFEHLLFRPGRC